MELKKTQIEVLKTLARNKNKWMGMQEILKDCTVKNTGHINSAIRFFMENDFVYQVNQEGKVMISPDGLSAVSDYL